MRVIVVTGLSGSGKSTAIHVLEDLGYYCIDNLPAVLVPRFVELCESLGEGLRRVALGIDVRERAFFEALPEALEEVRGRGHAVEILFLDAADEVLLRRFSETRRPHPLADGGSPIDGVRRERTKLAAIRGGADRILDTTALTVHELRDALTRDYGETAPDERFTVFLVSFGFKYGIPSEADSVFDVRFLPNPFFVDRLRPMSGLDTPVRDYVWDLPDAQEFFSLCLSLLDFSLPRYQREGKRYFTAALGCTGGRHRSVVLVEHLEERLRARGYRTVTRHRDLAR